MTLLRNDINGLRGISVLMVVFYHFNIGILKGGFVGVDVFFVISGFLMTKIIYSGLDRGNFNYFEFVKRRAFRIFPVLYFLIFILLFCGAFFLSPIDLSSLSEQVFHALIFDSNKYYGAKTGYFSEGIDDRWLLHTWSLSVEWQFYLMYPVLLWLCLKVTKSKNAINNERNIFIALLICTAASLAYCLFGDVRNAFFSVLTRSWQMLAGGLVFMVGIRYATEKYASLLSYLGLLLIFSSVVMVKILSLESRWPGYYAILPVIGTCTILYSRFQGNLLLKNPFIQYLGTW
ncbi:MAG: acyltransferase [Glaciimonas sp.]|nr:acyltransferase [Glaciimonas sp.]